MSRQTTAIKLSLICLFTLIAMAGCAPATKEIMEGIQVNLSDNGSKIEVKAGDTLVVSLDSNPTTGYSWQIAEIDSSLLIQEGEAGFESESEAPGSGGIETFHFKALASGESELKLIYHRLWEEGVDPLEVFSITVVVK